MKNIIFTIVLLSIMQLATADSSCTPPELSAVIYFGNGINTDIDSAKSSSARLKKEITEEYNSHKIQYAIAYNKTSGMAIDLAQVAAQSGTQIDRRFMYWLNHMGIAPAWLSSWFQNYLLRRSTILAEEVADHANFYLNDILNGKKVIVVSHSQGNFYVNEAKELLARQLRDGKMGSFGIFGVAVPSDNIGGSRGPYLTNHRDFIQNVPRSLTANWKLHRTDRMDAEDVGTIQAHLFNATYISDDFDIRPALISGIKTQIDNAARPPHSCQNYNRTISSLVAGNYITSCGIAPNTIDKQVLITATDMTISDGMVVDTSRISTFMLLSQQGEAKPHQIQFSAFGGMPVALVGAAWTADRLFRFSAPGFFCSVNKDTPPTFLQNPFSITQTMMAPLQGVFRLLPKGSCKSPQGSANEEPVEFSIAGSRVHLGERSWNISSDSESVYTFNYNFKNRIAAPYTDPAFTILSDLGPTSFEITYARNREITEFVAVERDKSVLTCSFDQRGLRL